MLAVDTETTGLDFWHGTAPFFVSTCDEAGEQRYWEWSVDPRTRRVQRPDGDAEEIADYLLAWDEGRLIWHNAKFDFHALRVAKVWDHWNVRDAWRRSEDTIIAAHLIDSSQRKNLTDLVAKYVGHDLESMEKSLRAAVDKARRICRTKAFRDDYGEWAIADEERLDMPSAKAAGSSGADYWLPRELWRRVKWVRDEHPEFKTVLQKYANADTAATMALWLVFKAILERGEHWNMYRSRMETLPALYEIECGGVTVNGPNMDHLNTEYRGKSDVKRDECLAIARNYRYDLQLPKGSSRNGSLDKFMIDVLKLPPVFSKKSKTGARTFDKNAMAYYLDTLPEKTRQHRFVTALMDKRKVDTSLAYIDGYRRFWIPVGNGWYVLHPSINPIGTDVTRRSSSNPNEQNISTQADEEGLSLRYGFGPAPGREWWSMDYKNLELCIPAYYAGEQAMIDLFENPDEPPYFGSNHLLCAHILWPKEFEECMRTGESFKDKYKTLYKRTKNGNFAVQYGAIPESGTADRAYGQKGAQLKIQSRLGKIAQMNRDAIAFAEKHGYVMTLAEKGAGTGYPVACPRGDYGKIRPTVPLSYVIQGTAGRCTERALVRCDAKLRTWNADEGEGTYRIAAEVHDEIVFDFPARGKRNLGKINALKRAMELSGDDIGIPLKVDVSYHPDNWLEEKAPPR